MLTRISSSIAAIIFLLGLLACSRSETLSKAEIEVKHKFAQIEKRGKITIGIRPNAPPFAFVDRQNGERLGLEIDIARYITKELLGSEDRVQFIPIFDANQRIELLEQDKIDLAIAAIAHTPENQEKIDLSESYYASGVGLLTRKENQIQNWSDLQDKKVCGVRGMSYNTTLEEMGMELIRLRDRSDAYVALQDGRCLGFAHDDSAIASILQLPQWSKYWHQALPVLFSTPWSIGIPKGETELKQAVNTAILKMAAEGLIINNEAKWKIPPTEYARDQRNFARAIVKSQPISDLKARETKDIDLTNNILIDGSLVIFPIADRIAKKFMTLHPESRIAIGISGNNQGFAKFCLGNVDLVNATRPIDSSEIQLCAENEIEYIELPIAFDSIVVVSSTLNNWTDCLSPNELNKIWNAAATEKIVNWQQINPRYPDLELNLLGSSPDSNTYDYFTTTIVGNNNRIRNDYIAYKNEQRIVREIAENQGILGFIDFSLYAKYEDRNSLKALRISNKNNRCVKPNSISIADGSYDFLSRPLFIYIRKTALQENKNIQALTEYLLAPENSFTISEVGYVPLPQEVLEKVRTRFDNMTTGSIFAGQSAAGVRLFDRL